MYEKNKKPKGKGEKGRERARGAERGAAANLCQQPRDTHSPEAQQREQQVEAARQGRGGERAPAAREES